MDSSQSKAPNSFILTTRTIKTKLSSWIYRNLLTATWISMLPFKSQERSQSNRMTRTHSSSRKKSRRANIWLLKFLLQKNRCEARSSTSLGFTIGTQINCLLISNTATTWSLLTLWRWLWSRSGRATWEEWLEWTKATQSRPLFDNTWIFTNCTSRDSMNSLL